VGFAVSSSLSFQKSANHLRILFAQVPDFICEQRRDVHAPRERSDQKIQSISDPVGADPEMAAHLSAATLVDDDQNRQVCGWINLQIDSHHYLLNGGGSVYDVRLSPFNICRNHSITSLSSG
jgi:hypothetical protein